MSKTKFHHYVPKFFLASWTFRNQLFVFNKLTRHGFKSGISKIAGENYYYKFDFDSDHEVDPEAIENLFSSEEGNFGQITSALSPLSDNHFKFSDINRLLETLSERNLAILNRFIVYQWIRGPLFRYLLGDPRSRLAQKIKTEELKRNQLVSKPESLILDTIPFNTTWKRLQHFGIIAKGAPRMIYNFSHWGWEIIINTSDSKLWMSDNPVLMYEEKEPMNNLVAFLAISPHLGIVRTSKFKPFCISLVGSNFIEEMNLRTLNQSVEYVYTSLDQKERVEDTARSHPEHCKDWQEEEVANGFLASSWWLDV